MASVSGRTSAIDDILSTAMKIPNFVKRELAIKKVAEEMSIEENILRDHLSKFKALKSGQINRNKLYDQKAANLNKSKSGDYQVEMTILHIMINRNDLIKKVETDISLDSFRNKEIQSIVERISEIYSKKRTGNIKRYFPHAKYL